MWSFFVNIGCNYQYVIFLSEEYYHDNKPFDDEPQNTAITTQPGYGPNQWSTPPGPGVPYGVQPGPSHGYPPGGQYSGQIDPAQGQYNQNQVVPSAPPAEPGYPQPPPGYGEPPPGYSEAPPPYDFKDPLPHKWLLFYIDHMVWIYQKVVLMVLQIVFQSRIYIVDYLNPCFNEVNF